MHAVLLPFLVATVACPGVPPRAVPRLDRPRYVLDVRITRPFRTVTGNLSVTFTPNRPTDRLVFRLWPNGPPQLRAGSRLVAGPVTSGRAQLRTERPDPTTLVVRIGRILQPGARFTVHLPWRLRMPSTHFDRIARFPGGLRLGTFFPLLAWDPRRGWVTDPPARILGESSTAPAADYDLHVLAPRGLRALASGVRVGAGHWRGHAIRDIGLAVGPFRVKSLVAHAPGAVTIRAAVTEGRPDIPLLFARHALERLAVGYGPYPWRTFTVVVAPDLRGGVEYPTLVFMSPGQYARLIIDHETSHQWFYSLVGNDQARDPWLDETLATWSQTRLGSPVQPSRGAIPSRATRHVGAPMTYWNHLDGAYFYGVYGAGVKALRSLHNDGAVDCALRAYAARRAYEIARPGDLLDELNRVIPGAERRLRAWGIHR